MIFTPSNILTMIRGPLAFLFILDSAFYRTLAIVLAMLTDSLDGYLARRFKTTSRFGAVLDPIMDKFFVGFIVCIFIYEGRLEIWQALALISRDFAVLLFGLYLALVGKWKRFRIQSIWCGKITTTLQFLVLLGLTFHVTVPPFVFFSLVLLGFLALAELHFIEKRPHPVKKFYSK